MKSSRFNQLYNRYWSLLGNADSFLKKRKNLKYTGLQRAGVGERRGGTRDAELPHLHRDDVCGRTHVLCLLL
jgi:hypothetical protein